MSESKLRKIIFLCSALFLALIFTYLPSVFAKKTTFVLSDKYYNSQTILPQQVLNYTSKPNQYYKLYLKNQLVAIISDYQKILNAIKSEYKKNYAQRYPNMALDMLDDFSITKENVYYQVADIDENIISYLKNGHLGLKTNVVEFITENGVYDYIYVKDISTFKKAQQRFLLNFISEDALNSFKKGENLKELEKPNTSRDIGYTIKEKINIREAVAKPKDIFWHEKDIYEFLCYGRNKKREYYTVQDGDTLAGIGALNRDMSAKQLKMLNPDIIKDVNQVLKKGTSINVTYYTSPLTITVIKERLVEEVINPPAPIYIEDSNYAQGEEKNDVAEKKGIKSVLYEEKWINGVHQASGNTKRYSIIKESAVQAVIRVGTKPLPNIGTGNFIWPIDNVSITCGWACYPGHTGTDLQNMYNRYDNVYAADNGTVEAVDYDSISGNYIIINHNNGYQTYYGHLNVPAFPKVGATVSRGQIIGQIGMTGFATGPHTHFEIRINGTKVDACTIMPCETVPWR